MYGLDNSETESATELVERRRAFRTVKDDETLRALKRDVHSMTKWVCESFQIPFGDKICFALSQSLSQKITDIKIATSGLF